MTILQAILGALSALFNKFLLKVPQKEPLPVVLPPTPPAPMEPPKPAPTPVPAYLWDTQANTRHSVRVICDEMGLSVYQKNVITACVQQESQFLNSAKCQNRDKETGHVWSTDWGICQINDYYHVGLGKEFATVADIVDHPEKAVRFMVRMMKANNLKMWVSYSSGAYLKYMPK